MLLAVSVPILFVHETYQPSWSFSLASTTVTIYLADVAVLVVGAAALATLMREGVAVLRRARWLYAVAGAFLLWILLATFYGTVVTDGYRFAKHAVTAAKYGEYALLAVAVPLLARRLGELRLLVGSLLATSVVATSFGILQFFGVVDDPEGGRRPAHREPSFVGIHDFAALSGAALGVALALIAVASLERGRDRATVAVASVTGTLGLTLAGAAAGSLGAVAAAFAAALLAARRGSLTLGRLSALAGLAAAVTLGTLAMRSVDFRPALEALGVDVEQSERVESDSYRQRAVLAYIGTRTFADHPWIGVGWQGTSEEDSYSPYLADAHDRFPNVPDLGFPSPEHAWGVQNAYLQAAADLGLAGLLLFCSLFVVAIALAARSFARAPPTWAPFALLPILWLLVTMGVWLGLGLVAGIPLAALQWLGIGLAAAVVVGWEVGERP